MMTKVLPLLYVGYVFLRCSVVTRYGPMTLRWACSATTFKKYGQEEGRVQYFLTFLRSE